MRCLCCSFVFAAALTCIVEVPVKAEVSIAGVNVFAQADRSSAIPRINGWTRARWEAAKKRWAKDQEQFAACVHKLNESREAKRLSYHNQTDFLEKRMREKS